MLGSSGSSLGLGPGGRDPCSPANPGIPWGPAVTQAHCRAASSTHWEETDQLRRCARAFRRPRAVRGAGRTPV